MFDLYKKALNGDAITYVRPYQTVSLGPLNGPNSMTISEETIVTLADQTVLHIPSTCEPLQATITDPNQAFDIVNPATGAITGSMTFAQLKVQMYSLYLYLAAIRDNG